MNCLSTKNRTLFVSVFAMGAIVLFSQVQTAEAGIVKQMVSQLRTARAAKNSGSNPVGRPANNPTSYNAQCGVNNLQAIAAGVPGSKKQMQLWVNQMKQNIANAK